MSTVRAAYGTKDSYETRSIYPERSVDEIIRVIKNHPFNHYAGGGYESVMATIDNHVPGYIFQDCIKLQFKSEKNCREFEEAIKPYMEYFTPRKYPKDVVE